MALGIEWDVENWAEKMNETWEKGQPETGYLAPVLRGRCKEQSQPNWESSQEVHTQEPRKTQNSCRKISEWKRHQIVLLYYEQITRRLKSYTHKMTNSEEVNSVKWSNGRFINLKGNALSDKGARRIEESPGPLLLTLWRHSIHASPVPW